LAERDGELDGVGDGLGVAGAVPVEEGIGEPVAAGWLVVGVDTTIGAAGGGAAASAIPAVIAAMPAMAPTPSRTKPHGNGFFPPGPAPSAVTGGVPDSGPSAVTRCLPVVRPHPRVLGMMVATRAATVEPRPRAPWTLLAESFPAGNEADGHRNSGRHKTASAAVTRGP
jgi:hypothetical protein